MPEQKRVPRKLANRTNMDAVASVPEEAFVALGEEGSRAGGPYEEPEEYKGSVARTLFDTPSSDDGTITIVMPADELEKMTRQSMVRIKSITDGRSYLGVVVKGPFAEPDGLRSDAPPLVISAVSGSIFIPKYHGRAQLEIIGEELEESVVPPRRRPRPNSPVFLISDEETMEVLGSEGDILLGLADGHEELEIRVPSDKKSVLPRHVGILGTTGSGKSTTVSGMVAQFQEVGIATILFDTEGEYTAICDPTEDKKMLLALKNRKKKKYGVEDTQIYYLVGRDTANPDHERLKKFRLDFSELSPYAFKEILGLTDAQEVRFFAAYDVCKQLLRDFKVFPTNDPEEQKQALEIDELETGYPRMTLSHIIDIVAAFLHVVSKQDGEPDLWNDVFKGAWKRIERLIKTAQPKHEGSWRVLLAKLWRLHRLRIFDNKSAEAVDYLNLLKPGRVTIVDLSDTESPTLRNLVIAQLLRGVQRQQDINYHEAGKKGFQPTPTMVLIEEAHEFLSADRISQMPILFQQVARIARRGRKRWLGLAFISQLPQHLPNEVMALINSWIIHKISDINVVNHIRRSIAGVDESLWKSIPALAQGQAVVSFTSLNRPMLVSIDPTPCKLLLVD